VKEVELTDKPKWFLFENYIKHYLLTLFFSLPFSPSFPFFSNFTFQYYPFWFLKPLLYFLVCLVDDFLPIFLSCSAYYRCIFEWKFHIFHFSRIQSVWVEHGAKESLLSHTLYDIFKSDSKTASQYPLHIFFCAWQLLRSPSFSDLRHTNLDGIESFGKLIPIFDDFSQLVVEILIFPEQPFIE